MMSPEIEVIREELPEVARIVRDECWLEGERRGCAVPPSDPAIRLRVADIILASAGEEIRRRHARPGRHADESPELSKNSAGT